MILSFGNTIKELRVKHGLSQEKLAEHLGVAPQSVSKWERNEGYPDITFLIPLAEFFGVTLDTLMGRDEARKEIKIENLSFTYEGNSEPTLKDISLTIKPYEKIALVGYNGAGKTTLTNLLLRLYDPTEGSILIDGEDIRTATVDSHRDRFAAVFQDFQLFSCNVGENVALDKDYDMGRVEEALGHSGFSKPLKKGTETELLREFDDEGVMLSGGESQKVAIARAFYKNCPYVILDEPSANLDPVAEYNLNRAMTEASDNKTVIFISHRLSTTVHADRIYVMEKGRIIESGSHEELMEKNGTYAYMFNLQAEKYQSAEGQGPKGRMTETVVRDA